MKTTNFFRIIILFILCESWLLINNYGFSQCSINVSQGSPAICQGDSVSLSVSGTPTSYALQLDGVNDFVNIGDPANGSLDFGTGDFTWEFWVKVSKTSPVNNEWPILAKTGASGNRSDGFEIEVSTWGGGISIGAYFSIISKNPAYAGAGGFGGINPNQWYHVAYTRSDTTVKAYLNGILKATTTNADMGTNISNTRNFQIGENTWGNGYFGGSIDEIRIWNTSRSAAEIAANMSKTLTGNETGLVAYWKLDDGSGATISDASGKGNTGTLTNGPVWTATGAAITPQYSWSPITGLSDSTGDTIVAKPLITTTYTVTGTGGCSPSTVTVTVKPTPTVYITGNTSMCKEDSVSLTASGGTKFQWSTGDTVAVVTIKPQVNTSVSVTVTDTNTCSSSFSSNITVYPLPSAPTITQNGNVLTSSNALGYQWYKDGIAIQGATAQTFTTNGNGVYRVKVTDANGCSSMSVDYVSVGIEKYVASDDITFYPNPGDGIFFVTSISTQYGVIKVYNIIGKCVLEQTISNASSAVLDMSEHPRGIYFYKIESSTSGIIKTGKLIKE